MTLLLGIETATPQVACGLAGPGGVLATFSATVGRRHGEALAPAIQFLTAQAGVALDQLDAVAVDVGPGLFTGLRVGIATAQALGSALGLAAIELSSLDILADSCRAATTPVLAVVDARRAEVFWARYESGRRLTEPAVDAPADLAARLAATGEPARLVGDGAQRYRQLFEALPGVSVDDEHRYPPIQALLRLAVEAVQLGTTTPPAEVAPRYLRHADVRIGWAHADPPAAAQARRS